MNKILYRGKRIDNGKWVEGYMFHITDEQNPFIMLVGYYPTIYEVTAETVSRYVGFTDKNGKKIFVGDIIEKETNWSMPIGYVKYSNKTDSLYFTTYNEIDCPLDKIINDTNEVIGNIYDNSELLNPEYHYH